MLRKLTLESGLFRDSDLRGLDLSGYDLTGAKLTGADLTGAKLTRAKLTRAKLTGADLTRAKLTETCLNPDNQLPPLDWPGEKWGGLILGYRTKNQPYMGGPDYEPGVYAAPWFSSDPDSACHPGLYLRPDREPEDMQVVALAGETFRAADKYRTKRFVVISIF